MAETTTSVLPARLLFHLFSFLSFLYIFYWHFGGKAATLSQSQGFGWFFKYLTFCAFTFQMRALFISFIFDLFPQANTESCLADDLSCASFALANVVTVMFWCLLVITKKPVDQNVQQGLLLLPRPPFWLSLSVHLGNAVVAWIDILVSKRTFSKFSLQVALMFGILYCIWIQICAIKNKAYPYPFLNELPKPTGIIGVMLTGLFFTLSFFKVGSKVAYAYGGSWSHKMTKSD